MPIGLGTGLLIGGLASAGASVTSGIIGSKAAGKAAKTQSDTALQAAQLENQATNRALDLQKEQFEYQKGIQAPWVQSGTEALSKLSDFAPFKAPGAESMSEDPGYKFRVSEGLKAIERSAAARGGVLSGGTLKSEQQYASDLASQEYGNVYARRAAEYQNAYDQLAARAGIGRSATSDLASASRGFASDAGSLITSGAARQGQAITDAGAARASGYAASGNIWGNTVGNLGQLPLELIGLKKILAA